MDTGPFGRYVGSGRIYTAYPDQQTHQRDTPSLWRGSRPAGKKNFSSLEGPEPAGIRMNGGVLYRQVQIILGSATASPQECGSGAALLAPARSKHAYCIPTDPPSPEEQLPREKRT